MTNEEKLKEAITKMLKLSKIEDKVDKLNQLLSNLNKNLQTSKLNPKE